MSYTEQLDRWLNSPYISQEIKNEIKEIKDEKEVEDRFYKELEFGTGGLRGKIGAGTNRMNIYTVSKATQGLADYLNLTYKNEVVRVCIGYDSRNMSKEFSEISARVLSANGIEVELYPSLRPTPMISFGVRRLSCKAGIVITASHNPKEYNGYKVYGCDGGQITDKVAKEIYNCIENIDDFSKVKFSEEGDNKIHIITESIDNDYYELVKSLAIRKDMIKNHASELSIIYTPIHGSGNIPVRRILQELGFSRVQVVKEQEGPNGNFPTATYPNPEDSRVFSIALNLAKDSEPDIIFGTDPDCDRIGVVVKDSCGDYKILTGNQTGVLITNYILSSLKEQDILPDNAAVIKTIVTTDMVKKITDDYNVSLINVLTGFKYIGEKIKEFNEDNSYKYLFGFEESYGYLAGDFVRDKDAVSASLLISEMALYYKLRGMNLYDALNELYESYGYYKENLISMELEGKLGAEKIQGIMEYLRHSMTLEVGDSKIVKKLDYKLSLEKNLLTIEERYIDLPKSNVLKFVLEDESWFVVRPSGTEPKMKVYLSVWDSTSHKAEQKMDKFSKDIMEIINEACSI